VQASKSLLRAPLRDGTRRTLREESAVFQERLRSPEAAAAFAAFLQKAR